MSIRPHRIEIPPRASELLDRDAALAGAVRLALADFEPWLEDNKLVFFPEYTDHGPDHIRQVLATASSLIADAAWPVLSPGDMAALVLSALLHDCAMHLSEDGFIALVTAERSSAAAETPWPQLWRQFLGEASRFDGRKLTALFGTPERVSSPRLDRSGMSRTDRLLIGEFLRRHHARLAHEIAIDGVPGPAAERLQLRAVPSWLANLAGLIARSHGMSIRSASESLPKFERRVQRNVHAPFIMAVLRIADYLQVHSERAPAALLHVRGLSSPVSRGEWSLHEIIETIHAFDDDPEALFIVARPRRAAEFTRARGLFESIQRELDQTWALLGEVYGRVPSLNQLGLTLRRVKSNLDQVDEFAKTVDFVPAAASFTTAGGELLKLLVGPLYNDDAAIAVRELLQNAVDAVLELRDYVSMAHRRALTDHTPDVVVDLRTAANGTGSLTIEDRGIGMTADTVLNYFLRAGASYRRSDAWREQHTSDGHARVHRSGRFGIGALAAFLAGDRIHVTTRHVSSPAGISFSAGIDDELIDLKQDSSRDVGTTIHVELRPEIVKQFHQSDGAQWDWYCLSDPLVMRRHNGKVLRQRITWPPVRADLPPLWNRITVPGYLDIQYMFSTTEPGIVCNGILISKHKSANLEDGIRRPNLSVFDGDASLPLDLRRSQTIDPLPFTDTLLDAIVRSVIRRAAVEAPEEPEPLLGSWQLHHPALYRPQDPYGSWIFWTPQGWRIAHDSSLGRLGTERLVIGYDVRPAASHLDPNAHAVIGARSHGDLEGLLESLVKPNARWWAVPSGLRLLVPVVRSERMTHSRSREFTRDFQVETKGRWRLFSWGSQFEPSLDLEAIAARLEPNSTESCLGELLMPARHIPTDKEVGFRKRWRDLLPDGILPRLRADRARLLATIFGE